MMRAGNAAALLGAALVLGACAGGNGQPVSTTSEAEAQQAELSPEISGPGLPLPMAMPLADARRSLERVAASCWLDDVVGGGSMIVDRKTGRVIITSDTEDLLIAELVAAGEDSSIARLTGPATEDPAIALRLSETLEASIASGNESCTSDA